MCGSGLLLDEERASRTVGGAWMSLGAEMPEADATVRIPGVGGKNEQSARGILFHGT